MQALQHKTPDSLIEYLPRNLAGEDTVLDDGVAHDVVKIMEHRVIIHLPGLVNLYGRFNLYDFSCLDELLDKAQIERWRETLSVYLLHPVVNLRYFHHTFYASSFSVSCRV